MEEERIPQRKKKKRRNYGNRLAFVIAGAVIFAYVFFEIFSAYFGGLETEPAVQVSVNDSFNAVGWFFRDEAPIEGRTGESAKHIVYSGERVQKDAPLATIYADEAALALLKRLKNKKIFLFGTAGFGESEAYFQKVLDRVKESIDESNSIIGTYMCQGKMPMAVRERYEKMKQQPNPAPNLDGLIRNFDRALTHPDDHDLEELKQAVRREGGQLI